MHIGVDLGGTKTEAVCLDADSGAELFRHRVPSPRGDYRATVGAIAALVTLAEDTLSQKGTVGVGIPGTVSADTGLVKNANSTWLNGQPLDKDLAAALGRPVRVENDANCFALSEAVDGAGKGKSAVFAVIIGTGCGAGIAVDGRILGGPNRIAGEWGHNPLPAPRFYRENAPERPDIFGAGASVNPTYAAKPRPVYFTDDGDWNEYPGTPCYCGKRGCLETWISGTGLENDYARVTGEALSTHAVIDGARKGEPRAAAALERYVDRLARALAEVINILDPDVIVLGGGMSNVAELYDRVPHAWEAHVFSDVCHTPLVPARHGDSSGVRGAAWLWNEK
ncbi:MAG: ROK family protein [Alphaproteobacteria bacterium]|nr:ROK family protein [Alphaproteobacteria bacterium]